MTKLYENIQFLRKAKHIKSLRQLETLVGLTPDSIKTWKNRLPNCVPIIKLANYFDVSVDYLLGIPDIPKPESICDTSSLVKILQAAKTLDLSEYDTDIIVKMMYILAETAKLRK